MTALLEWLLDLDRIHIAEDAPLIFHWKSTYPAWLAFGIGLLLACVTVALHQREGVSRGRRLILTSLRLLLIALILTILRQPTLTLQRSRIQPSSVSLLVDTSTSMLRQDAIGPSGHPADEAAPNAKRLEAVRDALLPRDAAPLRALAARHRVDLVTFSRGVSVLSFRGDSDDRSQESDLIQQIEALEPSASQTDLHKALEAALQRQELGPVAAIVLATDGQSTEYSDASRFIAQAKALKIPIYSILVGDPIPPKDLSIVNVNADRDVFAGDIVAVMARIEAVNLPEPRTARTQLVDSDGNTVAATSVEIGGGTDHAQVELRFRPKTSGRQVYELIVSPLEGELNVDNNRQRVSTYVRDDQLRVLYVEGYPRFEYRYIKAALIREPSIIVSCLLLSADHDFPQEGDQPIRRFPVSEEELDQYDVVLFGDVDPEGNWWTQTQAELLVQFVSERGGGFGLIAGERFAPQRYASSILRKLIPVMIDPQFQGHYTSRLDIARPFRLTAEGEGHRIFRFFEDPQVNARATASLPGVYWVAQVQGPRPGSEVLATLPLDRGPEGAAPVAVLSRYGAGTIYYQASDDLWLWRLHSGEALYDAYWVQVVRSLAPVENPGMDPRVVIQIPRTEYRLGEAIPITVRIHDAALLSELGNNPTIQVKDDSGRVAEEAAMQLLDPQQGWFEVSLTPVEAGDFTISVPDVVPPAGASPAHATVLVRDEKLELRHPESNHALLEQWAEETGGRTVPLDQIENVLSTIPDRSVRTPDDISEPLWDSRLVLILFISIIAMEWVLRKAFGLL